MAIKVLYICDKKMKCNDNPLCGDRCTGCCHTTDERHAANKSNIDLIRSFLNKFELSTDGKDIFIEERIE